MEVFSARLKWLRELKGYSQQDMADKLGLSQPYYGRFERNKGEPNLETLAKLPEILGETVDFLIGVVNYTKEMMKLHERLILIRGSISYAQENISRFTTDVPAEVKDHYISSLQRYLNESAEIEKQINDFKKIVPM